MATMIISINMKDGTKYATQVEAETLEDVEAMVSKQQRIKLTWPDAFAICTVSEISSITVGLAKTAPIESEDVFIQAVN